MSRFILKSNTLAYMDQLHGHQRGEMSVFISVFTQVRLENKK